MTALIELTPFNSVSEFLIVALIIAIGQFLKSSMGFGSGMFTISVTTLLFGKLPIFVPLLLLLSFPSEVTVVIKEWKKINLSTVWPFILISVPAIAFGSFVLARHADESLLLLLGVLISLFALYFLFSLGRNILKHPAWKYIAAVASGLLGSMFGVAGPPLVIYFQGKGLSKGEFRGQIQSIFLSLGTLRIVFYLFMGLFSLPLFIGALICLPFSLLGLWSGMMFHNRLSESGFRTMTAVVLLVSGIGLVISNL